MNKRIAVSLIIAVIVIVLVVLLVYFGSREESKEGKLDQIKDQIDTIMGRLDSLESQQAEMKGAAESVAEQLAVINSNLGQMDHEIKQVKDDVKGFEDILFRSDFKWSDFYVSPAIGILIIVLLVAILILYIRLKSVGKAARAAKEVSKPAETTPPPDTYAGAEGDAETTGEEE